MGQSREHLNELHQTLENILEQNDVASLQNCVNGILPADLAILLGNFSESYQNRIFNAINDTEDQQEVLSFAEGDLKSSLFSLLDEETRARFIVEMPPDEAVDLLEDQSPEEIESILSRVDSETEKEIRSLRQYEEGTAGSMMTTDFLSVRAHAKIHDVVRIIGDSTNGLESIDTGFVLTEAGKLLGEFRVQDLLVQKGDHFVVQFLDEDVVFIRDFDSTEKAFQLMTRHGLNILPVLNHAGEMKGIITADDMLDVAREIMDQDFYQMVGANGDPSEMSVFSRSMHRLPWLASTLAGGLVAGLILTAFAPVLATYTVLFVFVPFVIAMAGNVGVQSATIIVREMVGNDRFFAKLRKDIFKEIFTGMLNAFIFALATFLLISLYCYVTNWDAYALAPAVAIGLMSAMSFAAIMGASIPIVFNRLGIDPAISSGPIITVTTDIVGISIYLGFASLILKAFGVLELHFVS
jgi:magnesium transporter